MAQVEQIARFNTPKGIVQVLETAGRATFQFEQGGTFSLPDDWRQTSIEKIVPLGNRSTAVVIGYARGACSARQSLIVIEADKVRGPYDIGGCEDSLAYQVSRDRNAFVAVRTSVRPTQAWVYSADDHAFRGPATIKLPDGLARLMVDQAPVSATAGETMPVTMSDSRPLTETPISAGHDTQIIKELPAKKPVLLKPKRETLIADVKIPSTEQQSPRPMMKAATLLPPAPEFKPISLVTTPLERKQAISTEAASAITSQVKKSTKPQPQVTIDLSS